MPNNNYIPDSPHNATIPTGIPGVMRHGEDVKDNTRDDGEE